MFNVSITSALVLSFLALGAQRVEAQDIEVHKSGKVTNYVVKGQLASTKDIGCLKVKKLKRDASPADYFKGLGSCLDKGRDDDAAGMYYSAVLHGLFDFRRVTDRTAHQGLRVLQQQTFATMAKDDVADFQNVLKAYRDGDKFAKLCKTLKKRGAPTHSPDYMIKHGIKAFGGFPYEGALQANFDAESVWAETLTRFKCPA